MARNAQKDKHISKLPQGTRNNCVCVRLHVYVCTVVQLQEKFYFDTYVVLSGLIFINFFSLPVSF